LRPGTPDDLPLLGPLADPNQPESDRSGTRHFIAAGHFRNGILLAPVTAVLIADLIENRTPALDLQPFSPARFTRSTALTP
jgi:glycine oxidase